MVFSPFRKSLLAAAGDDGSVHIWNTTAGEVSASFRNSHHAPATGLAFSPVNHLLLTSCGLDCRIVFYDIAEGKTVKVRKAVCGRTIGRMGYVWLAQRGFALPIFYYYWVCVHPSKFLTSPGTPYLARIA